MSLERKSIGAKVRLQAWKSDLSLVCELHGGRDKLARVELQSCIEQRFHYISPDSFHAIV